MMIVTLPIKDGETRYHQPIKSYKKMVAAWTSRVSPSETTCLPRYVMLTPWLGLGIFLCPGLLRKSSDHWVVSGRWVHGGVIQIPRCQGKES